MSSEVGSSVAGTPAGAVAADSRLASDAGAEMLRMGGNAVDAAVAAALASGVVHPAGSGLGGGGFALVVDPQGKPTALDFREVAPAAATRDMFLTGVSSQLGGLAVAVPAEAFGLVELVTRFGKLPLETVVQPAIRLAKEGFTADAHLTNALLAAPDMKALFDSNYRRPRLVLALQALARTNGAAFRTGWVAWDFVEGAAATGGVLSTKDLENYQVKERTPLQGTWKGHTIWTFPAPSSGGLALLEMLGATEGGASLHCSVEAARHAMARRAATGGDPDFLPPNTPAPTLSSARVAAIRADCGPTTFPPEHYSGLVASTDHGTLHISTMDAEGWAVALTTTINTSFGSQVIAPKSGIVLNNEMDDFTTRPGKPNAFGLIQGEANTIAPGKRPLSSMTPTIVTDAQGRALLAVGGSGGPFIITATFQVLRSILEDGKTPAEAVALPRWHQQWMPTEVMVEEGVPTDTLTAAGHTLKPVKGFSAVQAVYRAPTGFTAGADPRKGGEPVVVP